LHCDARADALSPLVPESSDQRWIFEPSTVTRATSRRFGRGIGVSDGAFSA
jgi:hypothetical protein